MNKSLHAASLCFLLVLTVVSTAGILGVNTKASALEDEGKKSQRHGETGNPEWASNTGSCPSQDFLVGPSVDGSKKILDISYTALNDEDSGLGSYWALDHLGQHLKVWRLPDGSFYALKTYTGIFMVPQGGPNPGGLAHNQTESAFGSMEGGYVATFTGTFSPGSNPTSGNIGVFNYGGTTKDVLLGSYANGQTGPTSVYDYLSAYFAGVQNFNETHWGFAYKLDPLFQSSSSVNQWCNYNGPDGGNSGNIEE